MLKKEVWYDTKETSRTYVWRDAKELTILDVDRILVSKSGRHYIHTSLGRQYIIAQGWLYFHFAAKDFLLEEVSK